MPTPPPVYTYYTQSRPSAGEFPTIPLPIAASDIYLALSNAGQPVTPQMTDTINDIVAQQIVMQGISTLDPDYGSRARKIQAQMKGLGLYMTGYSVGPNAQNGG